MYEPSWGSVRADQDHGIIRRGVLGAENGEEVPEADPVKILVQDDPDAGAVGFIVRTGGQLELEDNAFTETVRVLNA
jgi:hypothetical protein